MSKRKVIFRVVVALCAFSVVVFGSTESESESESNQSQASNSNLKFVTSSEFSLVLQRLEAQQIRIRELENSHLELKEQFKSSKKRCDEQVKTLRKEVDELKAENSLNEDVWLLTPPLRGRRGQKGEKGDSGVIEAKQLPVQKGKQSSTTQLSKGDQSRRIPVENFPVDPGSISSCSVAMEILPPSRSKQTIYPHGNSKSLEVLCGFDVDGGGWTIIQKRRSGPREEFQQNWNEYVKGFGTLRNNFWLGLENIHALTKKGDQELRIELTNFKGEKKWAKYSNFSTSDASDSYRLSISGFYENSTAGDSMTGPNFHRDYTLNGMKFSTKDKDNDLHRENCAVVHGGGGGWWFNKCGVSNLNGLYLEEGETENLTEGIHWALFERGKSSLAKSEMKIRRRQ